MIILIRLVYTTLDLSHHELQCNLSTATIESIPLNSMRHGRFTFFTRTYPSILHPPAEGAGLLTCCVAFSGLCSKACL